MGVLLSDGLVFADPVYGGRGYIAGETEGIVTVGGQPAERKILLFERRNFKVIRTQWSKADGSYRFDYLNPNKEFLMVALDHKKQYEPVSYDFIKPYVDTDGG
nr:MAG TPA: hypothetical protein [Caudoviricetes sp.]